MPSAKHFKWSADSSASPYILQWDGLTFHSSWGSTPWPFGRSIVRVKNPPWLSATGQLLTWDRSAKFPFDARSSCTLSTEGRLINFLSQHSRPKFCVDSEIDVSFDVSGNITPGSGIFFFCKLLHFIVLITTMLELHIPTVVLVLALPRVATS